MKKVLFLTALFAVLCISRAYSAGVVSLNFENWGSVLRDRSAGVVEVANWNDTWLDNQNNSPMADLRDSNGDTTGMDVSWSPGTWGIYRDNDTGDDTAGTRNVAMMKGYLDKHAPDVTEFTLTEISYAYYDVYVYFISDTQDRSGSITDGTTTYYFLTDRNSIHFTGDPGSADYVEFNQATAEDSGSAANTNYAVFKCLTGDTQTISCSVNGGGGIAGFQVVPCIPYDPFVIPENENGTVGNIVDAGGSNWQVQDVILGFKGGPDLSDPNGVTNLPMNPEIVGHQVYIQTGAPDDPNLYPYDFIPQDEITYETDPNVLCGPIPGGVLAQATTYKWQVEEILIDPNSGSVYPSGDPNNIMGPVWTFTTISATPEILVDPVNTLTDEAGNGVLSITAGAIADNFKWFKVVGVQDTDPMADDDLEDIDLTQDTSGFYSGADSKVLTISNALDSQWEDAQFYAVAYNGDPDGADTPSDISTTAWVWYPHMTAYYTFENLTPAPAADGNDFFANQVPGYGYGLIPKSLDVGGDKPLIEADALAAGSTNSLFFNNPRSGDPNFVDAQYGEFGEGWIGGYSDITISAWVYWNGGGQWQRIVDFGNNQQNHMNFQLNPGWPAPSQSIQIEVIVNGNADSRLYAPENSIAANEWTHVAVTVDGDTAKIYINGEVAASSTTFTHNPVEIYPTANNYMSYSQYGSDWFNGLVDELKIWNYGLATSQIAKEYLADSGEEYVCDLETYSNEAWKSFDLNGNCKVDVDDLAEFLGVWLSNDLILPAQE